MTQIQISLAEEIIAMLDSTSMASTHSREAALNAAIHNYVEYDRWLKAKVEAGRKSVSAGRFYTQEEVRQRSKAKLEKLQLERDGKCK